MDITPPPPTSIHPARLLFWPGLPLRPSAPSEPSPFLLLQAIAKEDYEQERGILLGYVSGVHRARDNLSCIQLPYLFSMFMQVPTETRVYSLTCQSVNCSKKRRFSRPRSTTLYVLLCPDVTGALWRSLYAHNGWPLPREVSMAMAGGEPQHIGEHANMSFNREVNRVACFVLPVDPPAEKF